MPKTMHGKEEHIKTFAEYVATHCKNISLDTALNYASRGERFLFCIAAGIDPKEDNMVDISTCILWCLLKNSYDNGLPFGKGMFNIAFTDDSSANSKTYNHTKTRELFKRLTDSNAAGYTAAYTRISTHYKKRSGQQYGIDNYKRFGAETHVEAPWKFKTICFGICEEPDGSKSLCVKPETSGTDYYRAPLQFIGHFFDLIVHLIKPAKVTGTLNYRENGPKRTEVARDSIQQGNEIRFEVYNNKDHIIRLRNPDLKNKLSGPEDPQHHYTSKIIPSTKDNRYQFQVHQQEEYAVKATQTTLRDYDKKQANNAKVLKTVDLRDYAAKYFESLDNNAFSCEYNKNNEELAVLKNGIDIMHISREKDDTTIIEHNGDPDCWAPLFSHANITGNNHIAFGFSSNNTNREELARNFISAVSRNLEVLDGVHFSYNDSDTARAIYTAMLEKSDNSRLLEIFGLASNNGALEILSTSKMEFNAKQFDNIRHKISND